MKNYSKTYAAPARRNKVAVAAFQRSGAGTHSDKRPSRGPSVEEWDEMDDLTAAVDGEAAYEARAAFGPGVTLVNIITGKKFTT